MFIQTEATADPARLNFLPGCEVLAGGMRAIHDKSEATCSPLAERLFAIPGISAVSLGPDSICVTKKDGDWKHLKPAILGSIMDHFKSGAPILYPHAAAGDAVSTAAKNQAEPDRIRDALRRVIDPELGYNIVDLGFIYDIALEKGGIVHIVMTTTTPGCPATSYLQQGAGEAAGDLPGVVFVDVKITHEPRWTPEMMSADAKAHFGIKDGRQW